VALQSERKIPRRARLKKQPEVRPKPKKKKAAKKKRRQKASEASQNLFELAGLSDTGQAKKADHKQTTAATREHPSVASARKQVKKMLDGNENDFKTFALLLILCAEELEIAGLSQKLQKKFKVEALFS